MPRITESKRILVLSDNENVAKLINHISAPDLSIKRALLNSLGQIEHIIAADDFDLIILALSIYAHEPIVVLTKAGLLGLAGHIPILIISIKPFRSDPAIQITHMDLAFSIDHLNIWIRDTLHLPCVSLETQVGELQ